MKMEDKNKHIDERIREKLKNHRPEPPGMIWENIREAMAAQRKKRVIFIIRRVAAGIALLAAIGTGYYYIEHHGATTLTGQEGKPSVLPGENSQAGRVAGNSTPQKQGTRGKLPSRVHGEIAEKNSLPDREMKVKSNSPGHLKKNSRTVKHVADTNITGAPAGEGHEILALNQNPEPANYDFKHAFLHDLPIRKEDTITTFHPATEASWEMLAYHDESLPGEEKKQDRLSLAATFSPVYSYRNLHEDNTSLKEYLNNSENAVISYSGGFNLGYQASRRVRLQTGLVYTRLGVEVGSVQAVAGYDLDQLSNFRDISQNANYLVIGNSIGEVTSSSGREVNFSQMKMDNQPDSYSGPGNSPVDVETAYQPLDVTMNQWFHFIEIPVMFQYKIIDHKFDLNLMGGLSTNFLLTDNVTLDENGEKSFFGTTGDIRRINYSGNLGIGIDIDLNKKLLFTFEPQLKYYLNSFNNHNLISTRPYYIGMYTGIRYAF